MADQRDGGIAWTDESWNPVRGCSRVSPGCTSCYAERQAARFSGPGQPYEGLVRWHVRTGAGYSSKDWGGELHPGDVKLWAPGEREPRWTGVVRLVPEHLGDPLRWRRPRRVFVNSMSDLFHEALSDEDIAAVFGVMAACPQHTFQVLTKRAERMRRWFAWAEKHGNGYDLLCDGMPSALLTCAWEACTGESWGDDIETPFDEDPTPDAKRFGTGWPLPNVWLGVSCEDQQRADARIPHLLATPAAVRWVSYEPAIGPVDWTAVAGEDVLGDGEWQGSVDGEPIADADSPPGIDWIVVGGESGPGARPFDLAWARSTIAQCREAGVPVFFKQAGAHVVDSVRGLPEYPMALDYHDRKGGDPSEWPEDLRIREFPAVPRG